MSKPDFTKVFKLIEKRAHEAEVGAGYGGEYGDRGASRLRELVEYFKYGLESKLPPAWQEYDDEVKRVEDPEWETFLRLKNKFGK